MSKDRCQEAVFVRITGEVRPSYGHTDGRVVRRRFLCALPVAILDHCLASLGGGCLASLGWGSLRSPGARFARLGCSYATLRSARVRGASKNDRYATLKHIPVFNFHIATQVQKASTILVPVRSTSTRYVLEYHSSTQN